MEDLRIGVVGVHGIGVGHLFAVPGVDGARLAAVCDVNPDFLARAAADHGAEPFADAPALYASGAVDAVVLATPPATHGVLARAAFDAGLHVYCEKPVTPTAAEARALGRAARDAGVVFAVGHQYRFHAGFAAARRLVEDGTVGDVFRADLCATNWFRAQHYFEASPWRATWRAAGGGVLLSQAVHQVDAFLSLTGRPARVTARAYRARHRAEVEDEVLALVEWGSGARGVAVASLNDPAGADRVELHGERASVVVEGYDVRVARHDRPAQELCDDCDEEFPELEVAWEPVDVPRAPSEWFDMLLDAHRDFVAAVRGGRPPACDADGAAHAVEFANAVYLSAVRDEPVSLPLDDGEYAEVYERLCRGEAALPVKPGVPG